MGEYADPIDEKEGLEEYGAWMGLRNNTGEEMFARGDMVTGLNIDISDSLDFSRRKGFSAPVVAGVDRSLWASGSVCLGVGSNALKQVLPDYSTRTLRAGLTASKQLSYAMVGDRVFYSNGVELGCVQNGVHRTWGLTPPSTPVAAAGAGTLAAGKYQFVVTYIRADGQESGAGRAGAIDLTTAGGIDLSSIPVSSDPTVTHKAIYATSVGGETLYRTGVIDNATITFAIRDIRMGVSPLLTQFLSPPPAGDFIGYWKGWMLVAKDTWLYPSEAYAPELFDVRKSIHFSDTITMVAPLNNKTDGVWVGTNSQVVFLAGASPDTWEFKSAADYGVISGTLSFADGELFGDGAEKGDTLAFFATTRGLCVGKSDGTLVNLTQARYAYPSMDRGAGVVRLHRGMAQYLVTLQGTEVAGNVAA